MMLSKKSGFKENLVYTPNTNTSNIFDKKQSKRKIIWFNPFCSVNVITNIGKKVLSLLKKHLPKKYKSDKIFNKNNTKISYNCKSNILSIIAGQNKLLPQPKVTKYQCSCGVKNTCPLENQCQTPNLVIYRADVEIKVNDKKKKYFGLAVTTFKERFGNHKKDFNHKQHSENTELSKYIWLLKDAKIPHSVKGSIV